MLPVSHQLTPLFSPRCGRSTGERPNTHRPNGGMSPTVWAERRRSMDARTTTVDQWDGRATTVAVQRELRDDLNRSQKNNTQRKWHYSKLRLIRRAMKSRKVWIMWPLASASDYCCPALTVNWLFTFVKNGAQRSLVKCSSLAEGVAKCFAVATSTKIHSERDAKRRENMKSSQNQGCDSIIWYFMI